MAKKNVLITGSASGLGRETARLFAASGYRVFGGVRRPEDANTVAALHPAMTPVVLDLADPKQIASAAALVDGECGEAGLAMVINVAGYALYGPIEHTPRSEAAALFDVLTLGPVDLTNALLPALKRYARSGRGRGRVLNVISWASLDAGPFVGFYAAAKAAALRITQAAFFELARFDIDAIAIVPGLMKTPFIDRAEGQINETIGRLPSRGHEDYAADLAHMASMSVGARKSRLAASPAKVARKILAIAGKRRVRYQYSLGLDTALVRLMSFAAPFWLLKAIKMSIFGLRRRPLPA